MKITYDLEYLPEKKCCNKGSEETLAVKAFLAGQQKNMCIEYDDEDSAKRRHGTLKNFRRTNNLQDIFDVYRVAKCVYVVRTKKAGRK